MYHFHFYINIKVIVYIVYNMFLNVIIRITFYWFNNLIIHLYNYIIKNAKVFFLKI